MLKIGDPAPRFRADSSMGMIDMNDYLGNGAIVLIFYPGDFTPVCTAQLCAARDSKALFEQRGVKLFGVNPGSLDKKKKFADQYDLDFPLINDEDGAIRKAFGIGRMLGLIGVQRTVVIIGDDGRIRSVIRGNPPTAEIVAALR